MVVYAADVHTAVVLTVVTRVALVAIHGKRARELTATTVAEAVWRR